MLLMSPVKEKSMSNECRSVQPKVDRKTEGRMARSEDDNGTTAGDKDNECMQAGRVRRTKIFNKNDPHIAEASFTDQVEPTREFNARWKSYEVLSKAATA